MSESQESVSWDEENNRYVIILQGVVISGTYFVSTEGRFSTERGYNVNPSVRNCLMLNLQLSHGILPEHKERVDRIFTSLTTQALAEAAFKCRTPA
jgi:hypothetical protein